MEWKNKRTEKGELFIPAGTLIGLGVGLAVGSAWAGLCIGVGGGFLLFAILSVIKK